MDWIPCLAKGNAHADIIFCIYAEMYLTLSQLDVRLDSKVKSAEHGSKNAYSILIRSTSNLHPMHTVKDLCRKR